MSIGAGESQKCSTRNKLKANTKPTNPLSAKTRSLLDFSQMKDPAQLAGMSTMSAAVLFVFGIGCVSHIPKRPRLRNGYGRSFFENRIFLASVFDERGIPRRPANLRRGHLEDTRRWRKQWWRRWRLGLLLFRHRGSGDRSSLVRPSILPLNSPHFHALGWPNLASEVDIRIQPQHNQSQIPHLAGSAILRLGNITLERNSPSAAPNDIGIDGAERKASEFATGAVRRLAG